MRYVDVAFFRAPFRPVPFAGLGGDPALGLPLVDVSDFMAPYRRGYYGPPVRYGYGPPLEPWTATGDADSEMARGVRSLVLLGFVLGALAGVGVCSMLNSGK